MDYENDQQQYDDGDRGYDRDRSRSPRPEPRDQHDGAPHEGTNGRDRAPVAPPEDDEEQARNTGTNLFVTGIHPRLSEEDVTRLFEKYGPVEKTNIMRDPHTRESRGFGFVNMVAPEGADSAREGLQGEVYEGRTLSIEKARRNRPRTPTPGKYFGPPKREDFRGPPRGGRGFGGGGYDRPRYDDRGYGGRRDEPYRPRDRYDDRSRDYRSRDRYDDRPPRRDDRYGGGRDYERRGGGGGGGGGRDYYDKSSTRAEGSGGTYGQEPLGATDSYSGSRGGGGAGAYEDRAGADDRYSRR